MEVLFLVFSAHNRHSAVLQFLFQIFVDCEGDGLAGRYSHDSGRDSFVEGVESFSSMRTDSLVTLFNTSLMSPLSNCGCSVLEEMALGDSLKHILRNSRNPANGRLSRHSRRFLQTRLNGIDRCIGEWSHSARHETNERRLVGGEWTVCVLGLPFLEQLFEFGVGCEIHRLVGSYSPLYISTHSFYNFIIQPVP